MPCVAILSNMFNRSILFFFALRNWFINKVYTPSVYQQSSCHLLQTYLNVTKTLAL